MENRFRQPGDVLTWKNEQANEVVELYHHEGQVVVSSRDVAVNFEKRHDKLVFEIERMYGDLIRTAENGGDPLFIESQYQHEQNKQWYKEYLLTRDGFSLLVMGFTGAKALEWKLKYIAAFNEMEKQINSQFSGLSKELQAIFSIDRKQQEFENRLDKLENNMTIDYEQAEEINRLGRAKVVEKLGGYDAEAYRRLGSKAFPKFWNAYKRYMSVNSYKNTAAKDIDKAKEFIEQWEPNEDLELMIRGANAQLSFN